jgi:hypothetical protein
MRKEVGCERRAMGRAMVRAMVREHGVCDPLFGRQERMRGENAPRLVRKNPP